MKLPTINLAIPRDFPYPYGIYAGYLIAAGIRHIAAIHYGPIPTFANMKPSLEAYILSGHITLLSPIEVDLIRFIREIKKFPDSTTLRSAIENDLKVTAETFANEKADR